MGSSFNRRRRGLSLIEATMAVLVVAIAIGAGLTAATQSAKSRLAVVQRTHARLLAQSLMDEISAQKYEDQTEATLAIGREGEEKFEDRQTLDDVDDYHGLDDFPPMNRAGNKLQLPPGTWRRRVRVNWMDRTNIRSTSVAEMGIKQIVVVVFVDGKEITRLDAFRTRGSDVSRKGVNP